MPAPNNPIPVKPNPVVVQDGWREKVVASRVKFDEELKKEYLGHLEATGHKGISATRVGVHPNTVLGHIKNDPDFADAVAMAIERRRDAVVTRLEEEALEGHEETTERGEGDSKTVTVRKVLESNIRLAMLRKYDPEGYNPKSELDLNVRGGGGVLVVPMALTKDQWIALYQPKDEPPREEFEGPDVE